MTPNDRYKQWAQMCTNFVEDRFCFEKSGVFFEQKFNHDILDVNYFWKF